MLLLRAAPILLLLLLQLQPAPAAAASQPWVIAHRGASGEFPELTLAAFSAAGRQGADLLELDTGVTADRRVVALHEPQLSQTTNVAGVGEFAARRRTDVVWSEDGASVKSTDWFLWDFSLAEVRRLRKRQRMSYRDAGHDGEESVPTLRETLRLGAGIGVGLLVEVKLCGYYANRTGADTVGLVVADIEAEGLADRPDLVRLQAFEESCAAELKRRLPQLAVYKLHKAAGVTDAQLRRWRRDLRLDGVGVHKAMIAEGGGDPAGADFSSKYHVTGVSDLARRARGMGLDVLVWTLRNEDRHIAWTFGQDPANETQFFIDAGVKGLITDFPATCRRVVDSNGAAGGGGCGSLLLLLLLPLLASVC